MKNESLLKARTYSARFLEPGITQYQGEKIVIDEKDLMNIAMSFKGSPVCIDHQDLHLMSGKERTDETVGYVARVYKKEDGWAWCDYTIDKQKAVDLIESGCFVSCAYTPTASGKGGTYHGIDFDRKILAGEALHLALVDNPRYEGATIFENSTEKKTMKTLFKFLNSKEKENRDVKEIDADNTFFEAANGKEISAAELISFYNAKKNSDEDKDVDADKKQNADDSDDEYEMDGEKVKVSEMAKSHKASKAKKNAEEDKKENETDAQDKDDKKDKAEDKKENSVKEALENALGEKSFEKLENARFSAKADAPKSNYISDATKFAAGAAIYGSKSKAK